MAVAIHIAHVKKAYENNVVIHDLTADIKPGELFTLLGPSGCGKTTLLRMIAGFNSIEAGTIAFDDTVINNVPVYKRNFGMVFQSYAIFPNMTVYRNIEYGLKNKKLPKAEIKRRVEEIMTTVQISQYRDRYPNKLSGGILRTFALDQDAVLAAVRDKGLAYLGGRALQADPGHIHVRNVRAVDLFDDSPAGRDGAAQGRHAGFLICFGHGDQGGR